MVKKSVWGSEDQPNDIKKGGENQGEKMTILKSVEFGLPIEGVKKDGKEESCV